MENRILKIERGEKREERGREKQREKRGGEVERIQGTLGGEQVSHRASQRCVGDEREDKKR